MWNIRPGLVPLGVCLWVLYLVLYLLAPMDGTDYHLSYTVFFLLKLTVALPVLGIWMMALFGARRFRRYALLIQDSPDGTALVVVVHGLLIMIFGLIAQSIIGVVLPYLVQTAFLDRAVFIQNHVPVAMSLVGFLFIFAGSRRLAKSAGLTLSAEHSFGLLMPYLALGAIFGWYFYGHFERVVTNGVPSFSTGRTMALWTIAFPSVITWLVGVLAVAHIYEYANHVPGNIYRKALRNLVRGIALSLGLSVLLQFLALNLGFFNRLGLGPVLVIVYLLLAFYALGFVFIARGARALMRIEEVV
jgi:hypothetical protein